MRLPSVDSKTHGRTSCPGLTTTAVSVLPSRHIRMYTVYHVHIHMSEGLWFFNLIKKRKKARDDMMHSSGNPLLNGRGGR